MFAKLTITWGVLFGIALVVGTQILTWLGLGLTNWFVGLTLLFAVIFVALGLRNIKRRQGGKLSLASAALAVVGIVLVSRYVFQLYMFVYINYVDPNWVDSVAETWANSMQEADVPVEKIEQRIEVFRQAWKTLRMFTVEIIFGAIPQIVLGLITSLFFIFGNKRNRIDVQPQ